MKLVWFRNDLRLADNPALRHAYAGDEPVAALFILSPTQWRQHKLAPVRQRFLLAQVDVLGRELAALGIPLHLLRVETFSEVPAALAELCRELGVTQLYANQAIEIDELRRDQAVSAALAEQAVGCHWLNGCCVLPPGRVLTGSGEMFKVFTPSAAPGSRPSTRMASSFIARPLPAVGRCRGSRWPSGTSSMPPLAS